MTQTQQPEALRLAEILEQYALSPLREVAAELRRQHARIEELEAQLSAIGAGGVEPLRKRAAPAVLAAQEENHVDQLFDAVLHCPHSITHESVTLRFYPRQKEGHNALSQLRHRLADYDMAARQREMQLLGEIEALERFALVLLKQRGTGAALASPDERQVFEKWLRIKPCGAAHDFGWEAWKARASLAATPAAGELATLQAGLQAAAPAVLPEPAAWLATFRPKGMLSSHSIAGANFEELKRSVPSDSVFKPLYTLPADGVPTQIETLRAELAEETEAAENWRRLALQFDNHRLQALGHLKAILRPDSSVDEYKTAELFLKAPPLDGESVLAQRIAKLSAAATQAQEDAPVGFAWSGWACMYPGKLPRLYGALEIASVNLDAANGDQLIHLSTSPDPKAQADAQDTDRWMGIGKAIERACMDLPDGTEISVSLEKDAGTVTLIDQDGNEHENFSCDYGFAGVLNEAIDAALAAQAKQGEQE